MSYTSTKSLLLYTSYVLKYYFLRFTSLETVFFVW